MTKYCTRTDHGRLDNKIMLDATDDAATANWGVDWRMPTTKELDELEDSRYCTWTWKTNYNGSGVKGFEVKSKSNGNTIFLPATGGWSNEEQTCYMTCELYSDGSSLFCGLIFVDDNVYADDGLNRCDRYSVRPVRVVIDDAAEEVISRGRSGKDEYGREYVDLGLPGGVLWATCNVGASTPWQNGLYFAWGETVGYAKGESHSFDEEHYKWHGSFGFTKYCNDSSRDHGDNKTILDATDDAATANWGAGWRMPTDKEQDDLRNSAYCTWTWKTNYNGSGANGYEVKSRSNGNIIFLPAAGYREEMNLYDEGAYGYFWSSERAHDDDTANYLDFVFRGGVYWHSYRYFGQSVRAVRVLSE